MDARTAEILGDYSKALARLAEAAGQDAAGNDIIVDGTIQRFEFTFELGWKLVKSFLGYQGIECRSPRACIKEAFQFGLVQDGDQWISMLEDRNRTSHLYDEQEARSIYEAIRTIYLPLLARLEQYFRKGPPD